MNPLEQTTIHVIDINAQPSQEDLADAEEIVFAAVRKAGKRDGFKIGYFWGFVTASLFILAVEVLADKWLH